MGRAKHLSKAEKELISFNYQKSGKSLGSIAKFLDRSKRTVRRYKNYRVSKVKPTIKPQDKSKIEQDLFQKVYDECKRGERLTADRIRLLLIYGIAKESRNLRMNRFMRLPRYQGKSYSEVMEDIIYIIQKNLKEGNEKINLDI